MCIVNNIKCLIFDNFTQNSIIYVAIIQNLSKKCFFQETTRGQFLKNQKYAILKLYACGYYKCVRSK